MKKLAFMFIALMAILSVSACRIEKVDNSNQPRKSYVLNLRDFQSIKNYTSCDIHFTQSNTYKVVLKATPRWYDTHSITSSHGELVITQKEERKQKGTTVLHITPTKTMPSCGSARHHWMLSQPPAVVTSMPKATSRDST